MKSFGTLQISQRHLIVSIRNYCKTQCIWIYHDCLSKRKQRTRIDDNYSSKILFGVPQGSIIGPLLFNSFSFFSVKDIDIVSYTDVSTPCTVENNIDNVIVFVEQISDALFSWFKNTRLKGNIDKCHLLVRTNPYVLKMKTAQ